MKLQGKPSNRMTGIFLLLSLIPFIFTVACATVANTPAKPAEPVKAPEPPNRVKPRAAVPPAATLPPLAQVKPQIAAEQKMPFETKIFSLSARNAPLQDVVMGLAKEADLNLVLEKGVDPMEPVSIEIANLSLRKSLDLLFSAYDYYYVIEGNVLRVKSVETRFFKFEYPVFANSATSSVGGDVLGSSSGGSDITGEFTIDTEGDSGELNVWEQLRSALAPAKESTGGGGGGGQDSGGLLSASGRAQINAMTGTIVITDRPEYLDLVDEYLKRLEASLRRQVVIEARILEVTLDNAHQFGIDWTYVSGDTSTAQALSTGAATAFNLNFNPSDSGGSLFFLEALETQGEVNVLSAPRVNVLNGQSSVLTVGRTLPYLEWNVQATTTAAGTTAYTAVPSVAKSQAGISLGVTPHIGEDGVTTLHIVPIITDLVDYQNFTFDGNNFDVPIIDVRATDSIVRAPDGSTVVIAGMIQERNSDTVTGIPLLMDIPLLGGLFSQHSRTNTKVELVISLTPTIIEQ